MTTPLSRRAFARLLAFSGPATLLGGRTVSLLAGAGTTLGAAACGHGKVPTALEEETGTAGLDFPGNTAYPEPGTSILMAWNSDLAGAVDPFPAFPATYIWKAYPRDQNGYYSGLFHANYGPFDSGRNYYGAHPYPDPPTAGTPKWEISMGGGDVVGAPVVFDRWYTQVLRCTASHVETYYWNWPNTSTDIVTANDADRGAPANPAIIIGDAPWSAGNEVYNGILRGFQFYDAVLSEAEVASELAAPGSVRNPWYLNLDPTPSDILDKSGGGHHPAWANANRPGLWTAPAA